ncbi:twin-arginine translocase subunit TatC [Pelagibaculum spongiae]|uniref:Sec-independent protein translocase protein TatC n=1 Tax=Pelagibaculum spongiae TaxID=2080658 RepID=A0A2V1GYS8_9GAMM|nr:twin-arginine translocase subunit TatC [Pelagibaculum spongiae]PVZ68145.1 twin-arginine translocase subunit TatC [Pelagibaculum spongiae]
MTDKPKVDHTTMPLFSHLVELRSRLLKAVIAIVLVFSCMFYFSQDLYSMLAEPLTRHLPEGSSMIATQVASPFLAPFKLTLVLSIFIAIPYLLYQMWSFVAPGLYEHEKKLAFPLVVLSSFLFYLGIAFAYFVVFPLIFGFFTGVVPEGVEVMTDITSYLDFVLKLFFAFGMAFEIPIAAILLIWTGAMTPKQLAEKRPYVIVGSFVIGMLLTPPDIISQSLLAIPMWLLFEMGLIFARVVKPKSRSAVDAEKAAEQEALTADGKPQIGQDISPDK